MDLITLNFLYEKSKARREIVETRMEEVMRKHHLILTYVCSDQPVLTVRHFPTCTHVRTAYVSGASMS